jgi:hypothetical protein
MKNLGIIIVLVILGIIFYMLWGKTQDKPTVVNRTVTPLNIRGVDSVRNTIATQKWKEAEDKLRKVAGAAEAYWVRIIGIPKQIGN